jgi:hypothetical protein
MLFVEQTWSQEMQTRLPLALWDDRPNHRSFHRGRWITHSDKSEQQKPDDGSGHPSGQ